MPTACSEYIEYAKYTQELQEAYHSRASQNRAWIYVAGVLALGVIAASGGLAAAGAATLGTIALINISGGFSAGAFATIDNSTLAEIYTISANAVDAARTETASLLPETPYSDETNCKKALDLLRSKVSAARTDLEEARTNSAKAAVMRAAAQQESLKKQIESLGLAFDVSEPTRPIAPEESLLMTVSGGKPDYGVRTIESALEIVKPPTKANHYVAEIKAKKDANGEYEAVFYDSGGRTKIRKVTVKGKAATGPTATKELTVVAVPNDSAATIPNQKGLAVGFLVSGGKLPYTVGPLDANSQGAITLKPTAAINEGDPPMITVTLTDKAESGRKYGAMVKDAADKTKAFAVTVAAPIAFVGVPADRKVTLTRGESLIVGIVGGLQTNGYVLAAPSAPAAFVEVTKTSGPFVVNSTRAVPDTYVVTATDDLGQAVSLTVTVKPLEVTKDIILKAQRALKARGFDPQEIDGVMGPHTRAALKQFQARLRARKRS